MTDQTIGRVRGMGVYNTRTRCIDFDGHGAVTGAETHKFKFTTRTRPNV